jgi:sulfopyruvate decarboxylase subunit beta
MIKAEAIEIVVKAASNTPIVFTTGYSCRIAQSIADRDSHFYMTGSMGLAATIGTGISLSTGRTVVVVDGDGSLAMNPNCLLTAGSLPGLDLVHIVIDDGAYESTGGQSSPTARLDFCRLARAAGYSHAYRVSTSTALADRLAERLARHSGPVLLHCRVTRNQAVPPPPRISIGLTRHAARFSRYLRGVTIPAVAGRTG